jgi:hypothetical protein
MRFCASTSSCNECGVDGAVAPGGTGVVAVFVDPQGQTGAEGGWLDAAQAVKPTATERRGRTWRRRRMGVAFHSAPGSDVVAG